MPRKSAIANDAWERQRPRILGYYIEERKTLKEVRELMLRNHGFSASRQQYLTQLDKWNLRKYLNSRTWNQINQSIHDRRLNVEECEVHAQGYLMPNKKLKKEISRHVSTTSQMIAPSATPNPMNRLSIRGPSTINPANKIKYSNLPFLDFLRRSAPIFRLYQEKVDSADALQLFRLDPTLSPVEEFELDIPTPRLENELIMVGSYTPRSDSVSLSDFGMDLELVGQKQQILRPQHLFMQSPKEHFSSLQASIGDFCALLKAFKVAESSQSLSIADKSLDFWLEGSSQDIATKFSQEYSADVQFNFTKFVIHITNSDHDQMELFDSFFLWIRYNHLHGMIRRLLSLDTPTVQIFAFKAFESKVFLDDPALVSIVLKAVSKFLDYGNVLDRLLAKAASSTNVLAAKYLINADADPNTTKPGTQALNNALNIALLESCDSRIVQSLIDAGAKPRSDALQIAAYKGNCECAEVLLRAGCDGPVYLTPSTLIWDINPVPKGCKRLLHCSTPLQVASVMGNKAMVELLLPHIKDMEKVNRKAHDNPSRPWLDSTLQFFTSGLFFDPLKLAIAGGHNDVVNILLLNGADPNALRLTEYSIPTNSIMNELLYFGTGKSNLENLLDIIDSIRISYATALQIAVYFNTFDPEILLDYGADVNHQSPLGTAIQLAAEKGRLELIRLFLNYGAQINGAYPSAGKTVLQHGAGSDNLELVLWLIEQGAEVNATPALFNGRSALQSACENSGIDIVRLLLQHGADVNCPASPWFGVTALQAAASSGNFDIVKLLLGRGADVKARGAINAGGQTALEAAVAGGHVQVVRLLIEAGADIDDTVSLQIPPEGVPAGDISHELQSQIDIEASHPIRSAPPKIKYEAAATSVQLAVRNKGKITDITMDDSDGLGDLNLSVDSVVDILNILLDNGANLNGPVASGYEILLELKDLKIRETIAVKRGFSSIQEALLSPNTRLVEEIRDASAIDLSTQLEFACFVAGGMQNLPDILDSVDLSLVSTDRLSLMLNQLLRKYTFYEITGEYSIYFAAACETLLDAGAKPAAEALCWMPESQELSLYRALIRHGANPNGTEKENKRVTNPLNRVVRHDNVAVAEILLKAGADPNIQGTGAPLKSSKSLAMTKLLLSWGADANIVEPSRLKNNHFLNSETPLQRAAEAGRLQIAAALIEAGANPAARPSGWPDHTALHFAARFGFLDIAALLMEHDPDVDSLAERCKTAAAEADVNGHVVVADWLRKEASKRKDIVTELS